MIKAACHCTAVRFEISESPAWVLDCNCTLCRRYGAMWSYYHGPDQVKLTSRPTREVTDIYVWQDRGIEFHRCKTCGCVTHIAAADIGQVFGVNARMMPALDPASVTVIQMDNSHTGWFWTKSNMPIRESRHPPMPTPTAEDWR
jgi:hypothetical protein